jgi:hypothetical protein
MQPVQLQISTAMSASVPECRRQNLNWREQASRELVQTV